MNIIALCIIVSYAVAAWTLGIANYRTVYEREYEKVYTDYRCKFIARDSAKSDAEFVIIILAIFWLVALPAYLVWPTISKKVRELSGVE